MSGQEAFPLLPDPPAPAPPAPAPATPAPAPALPAPIAPVSKLQRGGAVAVQNCKICISRGAVAHSDHKIIFGEAPVMGRSP